MSLSQSHSTVSCCTGLIEDLGNDTERVDIKIQRETRRIEKTTRKSGNLGSNVMCWCLVVAIRLAVHIT